MSPDPTAHKPRGDGRRPRGAERSRWADRPGVRSEQVEFIAGPSTHGAWLFSQGDLLVTKVNGPGATLIMTSVRAPGGEVLSIKVERLEARAEAIPSQQDRR